MGLIWLLNIDSALGPDSIAIHSKSEKVCGVCFSVTKKSAEKVRKSRHKNFATKVYKSIKSPKSLINMFLVLLSGAILDFLLIYALLSRNFYVEIYALFPQIFCD